MKKTMVYAAISSLLLTMLLSGCQTGEGWGAPKAIAANSCDADDTCEAKYVNADSAKFRDAQIATLGVSNEIIVGNYLQSQRVVIQDNLGVGTTDPKAKLEVVGNGMLDAKIIVNNLQQGGAVLDLQEQGKHKAAILGGTVGFRPFISLIVENDEKVKVDSSGIVTIKSMATANATVKSNAYVCVNQNGILFKSTTPCT